MALRAWRPFACTQLSTHTRGKEITVLSKKTELECRPWQVLFSLQLESGSVEKVREEEVSK